MLKSPDESDIMIYKVPCAGETPAYAGKEAEIIARIGGQALFNGVLMRSGTKTAAAVREADSIRVTVTQGKSRKQGKLRRLPILRGIFSLAESFGGIIKGFRGKRRKKDILKGILLAIAYTALIAGLLLLELWLEEQIVFASWLVYNLFVVGILAAELIIMLIVLRCIPLFKRLFMYHAAEHKAINCYESGLPLTVENVRTRSRKHLRCGSNIVANLMVMVFFMEIFLPPIESDLLYLAIDIAATLIIFGIAYEGMRYAEKHDNRLSRAIGFLGGLMQQYLTTIEPTDDMLECSIAAIKGVLDE